jgi:acetyltransferase-like isoleucine patch superfamily enzyme
MPEFLPSFLNYLRHKSDPMIRKAQKSIWISQMRREGISIHPTIEITGRKYFREWIQATRGCHIGRDCTLWIAGEHDSEPKLQLGNIHIDRNCYLGAFAPISIGDETMIGAYSYIISGNHRIADREISVRCQGYEGGSICIGRDVWIGCHAVVLPGVEIGDCAVLAAGAVASKSIPAGEIWGGVPAKKIGIR